MRRLLALPFALLALPAAAQDFLALSPGQVGQIFCISRLGNDMAPVKAILTPELTAAIAEAEAEDTRWEEANPGEKPPLGDGIPWQAWPDYAPVCTVGSVSLEMDESRVGIAYAFPDQPSANFTDTLYLELIPGDQGENVWRIDNVAYATDGDLRSLLRSVFMD